MRRLVPIALVVMVATGCTRVVAPAGPSSPREPRRAAVMSAAGEAGARAAALAFLEAYADVPAAGDEGLGAAVAPGWLRRWSHWVGVQADAFPGAQEGELALRWLGPAPPVPRDDDLRVRDVDLDASALFHLRPAEGEPFDVTRTFGRVRVAWLPGRGWRVVDVVRDGLPLSAAFRSFDDPLPFARDGDVGVAIDSLISYPVWQFHLVALALREDARLRSARLVDASGVTVAEADVVTPSIAAVPADGPVEGIVSFDAQPTAEGLSLELAFDHVGGRRTIVIELEGVIELPDGSGSTAS